MTFRYRFVGFGTNFESRLGDRQLDQSGINPRALHENEIALDVGNVCWGYEDEPLAVIDHHFERKGQFPSASAAVLANASLLAQKAEACKIGLIWLVTHVQPDFDAFCSMYLTRFIAEHNEVAGTLDLDHIDWFQPDLACVPAAARWAVLLASYASHIDNSHRIPCPKHRALHSVLYAALQRGREYLSAESGATEFFDEVKAQIERKTLNPLFDSVLDESAVFQPELLMLANELEAYNRDVRRARKVVVHLQTLQQPFTEFFEGVRNAPLLDENLTLKGKHTASLARSQADGIYLKDPECLLFKEWARMDLENSSSGRGFLFTAVAYAGGRPGGTVNTTDYFFALDPEKADQRCLYSLWSQLQAAEVRALQGAGHEHFRQQLEDAERAAEATSKHTMCRLGFEGRAGVQRALFDDPWFDGSNYACTIVATPNRGTFIGLPGQRADMLDDPVAAVVRSEVEQSIYGPAGKLTVFDLAARGDRDGQTSEDYAICSVPDHVTEPPAGNFRFAKATLDPGLDVLNGRLAAQVGETLWRVLHPDLGAGTPTDFLSRHLVLSRDWIGVWSRRGVVVAFKPAADIKVQAIERTFSELVSLARRVEQFIESGSKPESIPEGEELTRAAARMSHELALPENRLLSRLFDALGLRDLLSSLRDLNLAAVERSRREELDRQTKELIRHTKTVASVQRKVEWLEIFIVGFYTTELAKIIMEGSESGSWRIPAIAGLAGMLLTVLALRPWKH